MVSSLPRTVPNRNGRYDNRACDALLRPPDDNVTIELFDEAAMEDAVKSARLLRHRYMTSRAVRDEMVAKGWISEGYGTAGVAMCTP